MHPYPEIDEQEYRARNRQFGRLLIFALCVIGLFAFCVFMASCVTASKCRAKYPTHDSIAVRTEYKEGVPYEVAGPVVYVDCDSVIATNHVPDNNVGKIRTNTVRVPCPPSIYRTDTIRVDSSHFIHGGYELVAAQQDLAKANKKGEKLQADVDRLREGRSFWRKWCLIFGAVLLVGIVWKVYSFLQGGFLTGLFKK